MQLLLNLQPHNRYDKNAIGIFSGDAKQGYIPAWQSFFRVSTFVIGD